MADWSRLTRHLQASGDPRLELSFAEIGRVIGAKLPASTQYPAFWSNTSTYAKAWKRAGYATTRHGVMSGHMGFVKTATPTGSDATVETEHLNQVDEPDKACDLVLVGCVKTKGSHASPAKDLYVSPMFQRRRRYAEAGGTPWYILSAEHGLLDPGTVIEPYDVYLADETDDYRRAWGEWVVAKLIRLLGSLQGRRIEIHASAVYVAAIESRLRRHGAVVVTPLVGLRQGQQLSWYDQPGTDHRPLDASVSDQPAPAPVGDLVIIDGPHPIGSFTFRWPDSTEDFDRGWDVVVDAAGRYRRMRHGLGTRHVYSRPRRHAVTFVDGWAAAEGVAPDDYDDCKCLISPLKDSAGRLIRPGDPIPAAYADFPIVSHAEQIVAPYSKDALAVRLHEDDITSWVGYALARLAIRRADESGPNGLPRQQAPPAAEPPTPTASAADVVQALLDYGKTQAPHPIAEPTFTPHPDANTMIITDPFAFLLAVIFDQGIPAERAWRAPYELLQRLGHLDPARIYSDADAVRAAVAQPPVLHRYREKMPAWLVSAAGIVLTDYGGDSGRIWNDEPTARELQRRLDRFPGIGQKKAAMAVEILERDLRVPIRELGGSDIAYDVHVRRVFLRTGLAQYDDLEHMVDVARRANPERPGAIDYPAWLVGRQWCHAGLPNCPACSIRHACAKDLERANAVRGA